MKHSTPWPDDVSFIQSEMQKMLKDSYDSLPKVRPTSVMLFINKIAVKEPSQTY